MSKKYAVVGDRYAVDRTAAKRQPKIAEHDEV
jgi:hypothetical protein